jgi:hypothetical protein
MQFSHIPNAAIGNHSDRPMMQKEAYPVSTALQQYLQQNKKDTALPIAYKELLHYEYTNAIKDENGEHTHWERVVYNKKLLEELKQKLLLLYAQLKGEADIEIESIDFCEFANSMPFRINIITKNNHPDFFYIKLADASRIYGLLLEQLLTSNHINFLYHQNTLVEEHIEGMPGDNFLGTIHEIYEEEKKLLATEFIRFNESCFARLLGDMRSYNFVVVKNPDTQKPFTIKAIDFDQQCYEGKLNLYLPQFYKENYPYVQLATTLLGNEKIEAIREEQRKQIARHCDANKTALGALLTIMAKEEISENYKVVSLKKELNQYYQTQAFSHCKTMGCLVQQQLQVLTGVKI